MNKLIFAIIFSAAGLQSASSIAQAGIITTIAGTGTAGFSGDGGLAVSCELSIPSAVATDAAGNVYISDQNNYRIRKVDVTTGIASTIAGGTIGVFDALKGLAINATGSVYAASSQGGQIKKVEPPATAALAVAGTGVIAYSGDGGSPLLARLNSPIGVAFDTAGNYYIADALNNRVRKVDVTANIITTVAGNGTAGFNGDGGPATAAELNYPSGIAVDAAGILYIADNNNHRIRKVDAAGNISTLAGNGHAGFSGDGGAAIFAQLYNPYSIALDGTGNLFIADQNNHRIRMVYTWGAIKTVAGNGSGGFSGDNGSATAAQLYFPGGVAIDAAGNLYIADENNNRVRKVTTPAVVTDQIAQNGLVVYPNPVQDQLTIALGTTGYTTATIYNVTGIAVKTQELNGATTDVTVRSLATGVYFLHLQGSTGNLVKRFVKM